MKTWKKAVIGVVVAGVLIGIVVFSVNQANKGVVTVQTAKVATQDDLVSIVTASGEIKPTTYTNVTAQGFGRITDILVKEGDHIKKGDRLLLQENVQASADVQAQSEAIHTAESGVQAADASYRQAKADLVSQQANMEKAKLDWERGQGLFKDGLIPKQDFDQRKSTYDGAVAAVDSVGERSAPSAERHDRWWIQPLEVVVVLTLFSIYALWAALQNAYYFVDPYLSPFYEPCLAQNCLHATLPVIGGVTAVIFGTGTPRFSGPKYFSTSCFACAGSKSPTIARLALFGA